ncbi:hypothetical protein E2C01_003474 [Portunus trituberculatus]|uniref:Uncharacterized protein n=1 Tax=Portunus trituberculatus TaxID=210409 RepID=A0A5B7CMW7_PORTR|nr:hypothetical protein [Portunus trituberculatus]
MRRATLQGCSPLRRHNLRPPHAVCRSVSSMVGSRGWGRVVGSAGHKHHMVNGLIRAHNTVRINGRREAGPVQLPRSYNDEDL